MFLDYFFSKEDQYYGQLEKAVTATQYEILCEGISPGICKELYLGHFYGQVRASEAWSEAEVSEVTYVPGFVSDAPVQCNSKVEKPYCQPGLILTVDQKG